MVSAGSGIGLACAHMYAEEGAAGVAFADINLEAAEKAAKESLGVARNSDYRAISIHVDITQETDVWNMVQKTCSEFGRIDYAVNSAGVGLASVECCLSTDEMGLSRSQAGAEKTFRNGLWPTLTVS